MLVKKMIRIATLAVLIIGALALVPAAFAQEGEPPPSDVYVKINNGVIYTNRGQQPQIVVQFGNRGSEIVEDVSVMCLFNSELGNVTQIFRRPFGWAGVVADNLDLNRGGDPEAPAFLVDIISFGEGLDGTDKGNIDLIPGQNHTVAFNVRVNAARNSENFVACAVFSDYDGFFEFFQPLDHLGTEIYVR
jgi:hypothetical protein